MHQEDRNIPKGYPIRGGANHYNNCEEQNLRRRHKYNKGGANHRHSSCNWQPQPAPNQKLRAAQGANGQRKHGQRRRKTRTRSYAELCESPTDRAMRVIGSQEAARKREKENAI